MTTACADQKTGDFSIGASKHANRRRHPKGAQVVERRHAVGVRWWWGHSPGQCHFPRAGGRVVASVLSRGAYYLCVARGLFSRPQHRAGVLYAAAGGVGDGCVGFKWASVRLGKGSGPDPHLSSTVCPRGRLFLNTKRNFPLVVWIDNFIITLKLPHERDELLQLLQISQCQSRWLIPTARRGLFDAISFDLLRARAHSLYIPPSGLAAGAFSPPSIPSAQC